MPLGECAQPHRLVSMKWRNPTAEVGPAESPADGTSPANAVQTGCRLRQTYKDDLRLSISAPFNKKR